MCEWLIFLMLIFGCDVCSVDGVTTIYLTECGTDQVCVEMVNSVPVRGVQFRLYPCRPVEIRTTDRTEGFFAKFNKDNGIVLIVSLSGRKIQPGVGPIIEMVFDDLSGSCVMHDINIVE